MKTLFIQEKIKYDGSQLRTLFAYLDHKVLGNSCVSFRGACDVSFDHMVDGEDLLDKSLIKGDDMLHFIIEVFDQPLLTGVFLQRLFAAIVQTELVKAGSESKINRSGDDLYWNEGKLSISIAGKSVQSILIHFAINISNAGTPVKTASLEDLKIDYKKFASQVLESFKKEFESCVEASQKVKPLT